jgi:DNA-binding transcriptional MerR regulator/methylmalonyl-CoA mutase cobalamin-binding subunit
METLRAWERRYGFPRPERRPGSNRRLYSDADLARLLVIQRAIERGYRVGDVIDKPVPQLQELIGDASAAFAGSPVVSNLAPPAIESLVELLARDQLTELESRLRDAAGSLGPRRFATDLAHPLAVAIGDAWAAGRISVRHEHVATELLVTQLRLLLAGFQDIDARPRVLLATLPGEAHTLPLQIVALYLFVSGAKPRLLGGPTPVREIAATARALGADVVGLGITPSSDRRRARSAVRSLARTLPRGVRLWIGGEGASALGLADAAEVVTSWDAIDRAIAAARAAPRREPRARTGTSEAS